MMDIGRDLYTAYEDGFKNGVLILAEKIKDVYRVHEGLHMTIDNIVEELMR